VLVSFVHGDMCEPVVIGGLYNAKDKPPGHRLQKTDKKAIRTKAGHELILDDTQSALAVTLKSKSGHTVKLDDQNQALRVTSKAGHEALFDDRSQTLTIKHSGGTAKITFDASGNVTVKGAVITLSAGKINIG
jgi:uncharacterized protein involved in type VI secretion and phage assembly